MPDSAQEVDAEALPPVMGGTLQEDAMEWFDEQVARETAKQQAGHQPGP